MDEGDGMGWDGGGGERERGWGDAKSQKKRGKERKKKKPVDSQRETGRVPVEGGCWRQREKKRKKNRLRTSPPPLLLQSRARVLLTAGREGGTGGAKGNTLPRQGREMHLLHGCIQNKRRVFLLIRQLSVLSLSACPGKVKTVGERGSQSNSTTPLLRACTHVFRRTVSCSGCLRHCRRKCRP